MQEPQHKPIKRSPYLAPLSREHHEGLLLAWKIKQGISKGVDTGRIAHHIKWFFSVHLEPHFKKEEEVFKNILPPDDRLLLQMLQEHKAIEEAVHKISNSENIPSESLLDFGALISQHIRFEERILFNHIESIRSPGELAQIHIDPNHPAEDWTDAFWL